MKMGQKYLILRAVGKIQMIMLTIITIGNNRSITIKKRLNKVQNISTTIAKYRLFRDIYATISCARVECFQPRHRAKRTSKLRTRTKNSCCFSLIYPSLPLY